MGRRSSLAEEAELFAALRDEPQNEPELAALRTYAQTVADMQLSAGLPETFEEELMAQIQQQEAKPSPCTE